MIRRTATSMAFAAACGVGGVSAAVAADNDLARSTCASLEGLAKTIMEGRHAGASMSKMIEMENDQVTEDLVIDAYKQPRMQTKKMQTRSIEEFGNKTYLQCYQALSK